MKWPFQAQFFPVPPTSGRTTWALGVAIRNRFWKLLTKQTLLWSIFDEHKFPRSARFLLSRKFALLVFKCALCSPFRPPPRWRCNFGAWQYSFHMHRSHFWPCWRFNSLAILPQKWPASMVPLVTLIFWTTSNSSWFYWFLVVRFWLVISMKWFIVVSFIACFRLKAGALALKVGTQLVPPPLATFGSKVWNWPWVLSGIGLGCCAHCSSRAWPWPP